ncbi:MAG: hypothetical protein RR365_14270 [Bacteroides sp.]
MPARVIKKAPEYLRKARIEAGCANRGTATLKVPSSPETIGRPERGEVPVEPADAIVYAKGYESPDILIRYCADCPVGKKMGKAATDRPLPYATLRVRRMIGEAQQVADQLERIAFDGTIDDTEREDFDSALSFLRQLEETITDMILLGSSTSTKKAAPVGAGSGR